MITHLFLEPHTYIPLKLKCIPNITSPYLDQKMLVVTSVLPDPRESVMVGKLEWKEGI